MHPTEELHAPREDRRVARPWWKLCLIVLSVVLCTVSIQSYWEQERPFMRRERAWRKSRLEYQHTAETLRSLGVIARHYTGKYTRGRGTYIDFSPWHGTKADLACLAGLDDWFGGFDHSYLSLKGVDIDDDGLKYLESLDGLEILVLTDTQVTEAGVAKLQRALPHLLIIRDEEAWWRMVTSPGNGWLISPPDDSEYEL